jgi:DNA polymerase elongation subunit (family B)
MYANVNYSKKNSTIKYSHYENGEKEIVVEKFVPPFYIEKTEKGEDSGFENQKHVQLERKDFDTWAKRKSKLEYYTESGTKVYGSDYSVENLFISEKYPTEIEKNIPDIKAVFIDIEVESENGFPEPHIARERVNLITIYDIVNKQFYTLGMPYNEEDYGVYKCPHPDVFYKEYKEEKFLLKDFIKIMRKLDVDVVSGWNSSGFDIPYLYNRIENVLGEGSIKKLAPFGEASKWETKKKNSWGSYEDTFEYKIKGLTDLDYLLIYKKFEQNVKDSYKLNDVCEMELKAQKKEHPDNCSFRDFYRKYWIEFIEYNIQDVRLLQQLDEKKGYINLSYTLSYTCKCIFPDNMGTVTKQETAIFNFLKLKYKVITNDDWNKKERIATDFEKYDGAFVKEPNPGLYKYIIDIDIASLYPSIMRMLNLSPETKLFQIETYSESEDGVVTNNDIFLNEMEDDSDVTMSYPDGLDEEITVGELKKKIKDNQWHLSFNNTVYEYKGKQQGVIGAILEEWYAGRKKTKKLSFVRHEDSLKIANAGVKISEEFLKEIA